MSTVKNNKYSCMLCKEDYSEDDLNDLRDMREAFYLQNNAFMCPGCLDEYNRLTLEEKFDLIIKKEVKC